MQVDVTLEQLEEELDPTAGNRVVVGAEGDREGQLRFGEPPELLELLANGKRDRRKGQVGAVVRDSDYPVHALSVEARVLSGTEALVPNPATTAQRTFASVPGAADLAS
ncbi:MAG: hypothetical protein JWO22_3137 [Frankiales bacterium]|nr:hypothetical protein [Frankiales bacterium]